MSGAGPFVLASGVQGGAAHPGVTHDTWAVVLLIAALVLAIVLVVGHLRRRARRPAPVRDEWQALAVMGELCRDGWQAQINLYGWGAPVPEDAPSSRVPLVELQWQQFDDETGRVTVARRVWAPSIEAALQAMVEDRRTDVTLEQIEQAAEQEDLRWDD